MRRFHLKGNADVSLLSIETVVWPSSWGVDTRVGQSFRTCELPYFCIQYISLGPKPAASSNCRLLILAPRPI